MNKISVVSLDKRFRKEEKGVKSAALKMLKILNKTGVLVEIYLTDSRKMRFLNKKFRGKNKTTTILSFEEPRNFILPPSKQKKIGEIYIKFPLSNHPINQLLCHGLLHLFGYNHQKKSDRIKMERLENLVMRKTAHY